MVLTWLLFKTNSYHISTIRYKKHALRAMVADTWAKRMVGLMYRKSLGRDEAMFFVTGSDDRHAIWMQNMRFPIDIVWLDGKGTIVDIVPDAPPARHALDWTTYTPRHPARYVLEVNAGTAARLGMKPGGRVSLHRG